MYSPNNNFFAEQTDEKNKIKFYRIVGKDKNFLYELDCNNVPFLHWCIDNNNKTYFTLLDYGDRFNVFNAEDGEVIKTVDGTVKNISDIIFDTNGGKYVFTYEWFHFSTLIRLTDIYDINKKSFRNIKWRYKEENGFKYNEATKKLDYYQDNKIILTVELLDYINNGEEICKKIKKDELVGFWMDDNSFLKNLIRHSEMDYDNVKNEILSLKDIDITLYIGNLHYSSTNCTHHVYRHLSLKNDENAHMLFCKDICGYYDIYDDKKNGLENLILRYCINRTYEFCAIVNFVYSETNDEGETYYAYDPNNMKIKTYLREIKDGEICKKINNSKHSPTDKDFYETVYEGEDISEDDKKFPEFTTYWKPFDVSR
jgi:hypothetical protein